ncbi:MAG TPA: hypothetical protein VF696_02160 [Candidatus Paceibacterota bacterium]|jgi:plastocyanin
MNSQNLLIAVVVIILVLVVGFLAFSGNDSPNQTGTATSTPAATTSFPAAPTTTPPASPSTQAPSGTTSGPVTITYTTDGFSSPAVTVPVGTKVIWVNQSGGRMWVGSDEHPSHTNYDGTSTGEHCANGAATSARIFDQCGAGTSYTFTFTKAGTWDYHNHANASHGGTIIVR